MAGELVRHSGDGGAVRLHGEHPMWEKGAQLLYRLWLCKDLDRFERVSNLIYDRLGKHCWREIFRRYVILGG